MAKQDIYEVIEVPLQDDTLITLRPASISVLKKGQKALDRLAEAEDADQTLDILLDVCIILLKKQRPELGDSENGKELAEELFDLDTVYKVIEVFLGVKLNDPKLMESAMRAMQAQENSAQ